MLAGPARGVMISLEAAVNQERGKDEKEEENEKRD